MALSAGISCRLAEPSDLDAIRGLFTRIVAHMRAGGLMIWNDVYPNEVFPEDIEKQRLYLLRDGDTLVGAFALLEPFRDPARSTVKWENDGAGAMYLYRLGIAPELTRKGYADSAVDFAKEITRRRGYEYLRLFAVDTNKPAVSLYAKKGFRKAHGVRIDDVATDEVLIESGYEIRCK